MRLDIQNHTHQSDADGAHHALLRLMMTSLSVVELH
jgi:hypothetical protein